MTGTNPLHKDITMTLQSLLLAGVLAVGAAGPALAQGGAGVASKLMLRGEANGVQVAEMRMARRADVLVVEADILNTKVDNRTVFYRFKWLDSSGMQVGDGESWKQLTVYGKQSQVVKSVAPNANGVDFRIEMNVE